MLKVPRPRAATSSPGLESATLERVARWQQQTLRANLALEDSQYFETRQLYEEALATADALLDQASLGDRDAGRCGLLLFGTSCNNIVQLARRQSDVETEGIFLYRAVERFIGVAKSARAPLRFRSRCLLHLNIASDALYRYFEGRGMWDAAASYSEQANAAMFEVRRLEAAALQRARLTRAAARGWVPDGHKLARQIRIDVVGSSPREALLPGIDLGDQDDVLRVLEPASELAEHPRTRAGLGSDTSSEARETRS